MTEHIYELVQVENNGGPFTVPGEIVEIVTEDSYSKQKFIVLIKLSESVTEEDEEEVEEVDWSEVDGVGATVATRMKASGFRSKEDVVDENPEEMAAEVKGLGPGTVEKIQKFVE